MVVTTPSGQYHEIGALIVALTSASVGWQVTYLGPNLPAEEISAAAMEKNARIVLLSIVFPPDDPHLKLELERIRVLLPDNISIFVGGRASSSYLETFKKINATVFKEIRELRTNLESYHSS
jgi:methanogenic corrinoid protein MtbC1